MKAPTLDPKPRTLLPLHQELCSGELGAFEALWNLSGGCFGDIGFIEASMQVSITNPKPQTLDSERFYTTPPGFKEARTTPRSLDPKPQPSENVGEGGGQRFCIM